MPKQKSFFVCQECGYESRGWLGKCPACNQWNTFVEEIVETGHKNSRGMAPINVKLVSINDIDIEGEERYLTGMKEMDRVLGGGIVRGSLVLV
ncbi:MAG TPA: DNA repair protein RadA, partial [Acetivibrio sp.]|nr:DNA repair protein RadA [Acetivibrio sp.]